jgi:hypothetical protein
VLNAFGRGILFLSSYTPLFVILGIKAANRDIVVAWIFVIVGIASGVAMLLVLAWTRRLQATPVRVLSATPGSGEVVAYVFTYLIPFVGTSIATTADVIALVVLFVTIGLVFINTDLVLVNPLLAGAGFHLHHVETPARTNYLVLSRSDLPPEAGTEIRVRRIGTTFGEEVAA